MGDAHHDAFGRPLPVDPARLPHPELVDAARGLAGRWLASADPGERWVGRALRDWLRQGGDLARLLGLRGPRGSHRSPQRMALVEHRDRLVARLICAAGSQTRAARVLAGAEPVPAGAVELVKELHELRMPASRRAVGEAARRARR